MRIGTRSTSLLKLLVFLLLLCILFFCIQDLFIEKIEYNFQLTEGFFEEPKDSLDVVYIGASPTFTSWSTPIAYKKYGITSWVYANNGQPFVSILSFLKQAYKRQPDAVFMICINGLYSATDLTVEDLHATTDFFGQSFERLRLVNQICGDFQSTSEEYLEILFPMLRYHSRWNTLNLNSFHRVFEENKGGYYSAKFFTSTDISSRKVETDKLGQLPDFTAKALNALLDYCAREKIKAVFVLSAQYRNARTIQWYNAMIEEIETKGFPVVNELADFDKIGLDDTTDFYNANHTNIHGALKITDYLAQYLLDHYDFPEKSIGGGVRELGYRLRKI